MIPKFNKLCKNFAFEWILAEQSNHHSDCNDLSINVIIHHYQRNVVFLFIINSLIWGNLIFSVWETSFGNQICISRIAEIVIEFLNPLFGVKICFDSCKIKLEDWK